MQPLYRLFAMETAAILVHSLSLCTKKPTMVVAKLLLCRDIICKRSHQDNSEYSMHITTLLALATLGATHYPSSNHAPIIAYTHHNPQSRFLVQSSKFAEVNLWRKGGLTISRNGAERNGPVPGTI